MPDSLTNLLAMPRRSTADMRKLALGDNQRMAKELYSASQRPEEPASLTQDSLALSSPRIFTAEEAKQYGADLKPGWFLKVKPDPVGGSYKVSYLTDDGWELFDDESALDPTGKLYSKAELQALEVQQGASSPTEDALNEQMLSAIGNADYTKGLFANVFPDRDITDVLDWAGSKPEEFAQSLVSKGRNQDTEGLLRRLFPDITDDEVTQIFTTTEPGLAPEVVTGDKLIDDALLVARDAWVNIWNSGVVNKLALLNPFSAWSVADTRTAFLATAGVIGSYMTKYIGRPWEIAILEGGSRVELALPKDSPVAQFTVLGPEAAQKILAHIDSSFAKYGAGAIFTEEAASAMDLMYGEVTEKAPGKEWLLTFAVEASNPVYYIPIGGTFGLAAKLTTKVPLIGKAMKTAAAGARAIELGMAAPITVPAEGAMRALQSVGERLGKDVADRILRESGHLIPNLLDLPADEVLLKAMFENNWQRRVIQGMAKFKPLGAAIEKGLGSRILVKGESDAVMDVVGRAAGIRAEFQRMGQNAAKAKVQDLAVVIREPVKEFGFDKATTLSKKMANRALPEWRGRPETGTLEDVLTHPLHYDWTGFEKGAQYVAQYHELTREVLAMLRSEGVAPERVLADWYMHRVVRGKLKKGKVLPSTASTGSRAPAIGKKVSSELPRDYQTVIEGVVDGMLYDVNPEASIIEYINEAFRKIADERFIKYTDKGLAKIGLEGMTPSERLARFPELFETAMQRVNSEEGRGVLQAMARPKRDLRAEELGQAKKLVETLQKALRDETIDVATIRALKQKFPEIGAQLEKLVKLPTTTQGRLADFADQARAYTKAMRKQIEEQQISIARLKEAGVTALPDLPSEDKIREAFRVMDYSDRQALRSGLNQQMDELIPLIEEQQAALRAIPEGQASDDLVKLIEGAESRQKQIENLSRLLDDAEADAVHIVPGVVENPKIADKGYELWGVETELEDLAKAVRTDPVTKYKVARMWTKRVWNKEKQTFDAIEQVQTLSLTDVIFGKSGGFKGDIPETITVKQAELIRGYNRRGKSWPKAATINGEGKRVSIYDAIDVLYEDLGFKSRDEFLDHLRWLRKSEAKIDDLGKKAAALQSEYDALKKAAEISGFSPDPLVSEAGFVTDLWGYPAPVGATRRGIPTPMSQAEYDRLARWRAERGLPPPEVVVRSKGQGEIPGFEVPPEIARPFTANQTLAQQRKNALNSMLTDANAIVAGRQTAFEEARAAHKVGLEIVRRPSIGEGYVMQPFAQGRVYDREFIDAFNKFFGNEQGLPGIRWLADVSGILRITKASLDMSAMMIQGIPAWGVAHSYLLANPKVGFQLMGAWHKAFGYQVGAFFSPGMMAKYMKAMEKTVMARVTAGGSTRAAYFFEEIAVTTGTDKFMRTAEKIMGAIPGQPFQRAEASFLGAGEVLRDEFWRILAPKYKGQERQLAAFLDKMTGIFDSRSIGVPLSVRQLEQSFGWFAPNYTRACLSILGDIFRGGMSGKMARQAVGGMVVAGGAFYAGVQYAISTLNGRTDEQAWQDVAAGFGVTEDPITHEITWRPGAGFMSVTVDGYTYGLGGFWYGLVRLAGNVLDAANSRNGKEPIDLFTIIKNGQLNYRDNPFIYWWYSRSSPVTRLIAEVLTNKQFDQSPVSAHNDFLGYPFETAKEYSAYAARLFVPMSIDQGLGWAIPGYASNQEPPQGVNMAALPVASVFGVNAYPRSLWNRFYDSAGAAINGLDPDSLNPNQMEAFNKGVLGWKQLDQDQQRKLLKGNSELQELYDRAQADSAMRQSDEYKNYDSAIKTARATYQKRLDDATARWLAGEISAEEYRQLGADAGRMYGGALAFMETDPNYSKIFAYFDTLPTQGEKYQAKFDLALGQYQDILYSDMLDANGDPDWARRDELVDKFIAHWGQGMYDRIQDYLADDKIMKGTNPVWVRKGQDITALGRAYWRLPYVIADQKDESKVPLEYRDLWREYTALTTDDQRDAFLEEHPEIGKDWRAEYRAAHPEDDARLALWGYGGKLQSEAAYDLVVKWSKELGKPFDEKAFKLPPRSLLPQYFEYAKMTVSGGGRAEAKLYRIDNPAWDTWGQANLGWKPVTTNPEVLRINVKYKANDKAYDAIQVKGNLSAQADLRQKYLDSNPEYALARTKRNAYDLGLAGDTVNKWVEYYKLPEKGQWRERYRLEHPDFEQAVKLAQSEKKQAPWADIDVEKVRPQRYDELYDQYKDLFDQYEKVEGTTAQRSQARDAMLEKNPAFKTAYYERAAYDKKFPEAMTKNYAEYYSLPEVGYDRERYLAAHVDFYNTAKKLLEWKEEVNFGKIPSKEVEKLYAVYQSMPAGNARNNFRLNNPDLDAWLQAAKGLKPLTAKDTKPMSKADLAIAEAAEAKRRLSGIM